MVGAGQPLDANPPPDRDEAVGSPPRATPIAPPSMPAFQVQDLDAGRLSDDLFLEPGSPEEVREIEDQPGCHGNGDRPGDAELAQVADGGQRDRPAKDLPVR